MPFKLKAPLATSGVYSNLTAPDPHRKDFERSRLREALINEISAWISLAALVVLLLDKSAVLFEFQTWQNFIPAVRNPATVQHMQLFQKGLETSCDIPKLDIANLQVLTKRDDVEYTFYAMPLGFEMMPFYPSFLLICVLAWSAGFQSYRSTMIYKSVFHKTGGPHRWLEHVSFSVWLAVAAHVLLWAQLLSLETPAIADGSKMVFLAVTTVVAFTPLYMGSSFPSSGPEFGRWVEYVLTSPLQIVIVACSVWTRDRATLYALLAAQAGLILCGASIEQYLEQIYKCQRKISMTVLSPNFAGKDAYAVEQGDASSTTAQYSDSERDDLDDCVPKSAEQRLCQQRKRCKRAMYMTLATLVLAWASFVIIWFIIITQFQRQNAHAGACDACAAYAADACPTTGSMDMCELSGGSCQGRNDIPPAVVWIVGTQCLLFGLFGLVQSGQIYLLKNVTDANKARATWHVVSYYYAILSVVAKSALEIGFLVMLSQMPSSVRTA